MPAQHHQDDKKEAYNKKRRDDRAAMTPDEVEEAKKRRKARDKRREDCLSDGEKERQRQAKNERSRKSHRKRREQGKQDKRTGQLQPSSPSPSGSATSPVAASEPEFDFNSLGPDPVQEPETPEYNWGGYDFEAVEADAEGYANSQSFAEQVNRELLSLAPSSSPLSSGDWGRVQGVLVDYNRSRRSDQDQAVIGRFLAHMGIREAEIIEHGLANIHVVVCSRALQAAQAEQAELEEMEKFFDFS